MSLDPCKEDIFRKLFPKSPVVPASKSQMRPVEGKGNNRYTSLSDDGDTEDEDEEICISNDSKPKCPEPDAASATHGKKKGNTKKP